MRTANVRLYVSAHSRAPGDICGVKVEIRCLDFPPILLQWIHNSRGQYRFYWDGPDQQEPPTLCVCWGYPEQGDPWRSFGGYPKRDRSWHNPRDYRWTVSGQALSSQTGHRIVTTGSWQGIMSCDPSESCPQRVAIKAAPRVYVPRRKSPEPLSNPIPDHDTELPKLGLP